MDEVMSGFGRTGKWFGFENHGIVPDMICYGKRINLWLFTFWVLAS
ncbi:MAG: aminotransferase class III-fold pyridoxal phosphate-dependent enzyme [Chitinophagaceae bacterium]